MTAKEARNNVIIHILDKLNVLTGEKDMYYKILDDIREASKQGKTELHVRMPQDPSNIAILLENKGFKVAPFRNNNNEYSIIISW